MRQFALSLLLAIAIISVATSWLFDHLYQTITASQQQPNSPQMQLAHLAKDIHTVISAVDTPHSLLVNWPAQSLLHPQIVPVSEFPLPTPLQKKLMANEQIQLETDQQLLFLQRLPDPHTLLVIRSKRIKPQNDTAWWLTILFYVATMTLILIWLLPFLLRLLRLRQAAQRFGDGDLSQRLQVGSVLYLRDLENEFNHMAERIEYLVQDVKLLSGAMSHELRTPLARIRLGMDTLEETTDPIKRRSYEAKINRDLDTLSELIDKLLSYARLDQKIHNKQSHLVDLCPLIKQTSAAFESCDLTLNLDIPEHSVQIEGDAFYLTTLLTNLLDNAQKYGQGQVILCLSTKEKQAVLSVHDNGFGVSPDEVLHIFKPFVRAENTQNTIRSGFGLGLALAQRIADWHQGKLSVCNSTRLTGACFTLTLPLK
ncbi:hypothetical protein CWB99_09485 [Pseudoalteromonas rubra]|uniref:histidine kinase n=1 Tax=Pseudoalteromonas rubra TaxID=43658 RepID=A0A5S3WPQ3_9GAMM|nr:ATP-binding protein [Pseudoalteromonas rubra]TMP29416.1 hypothetical protein CWB99_09485 [Pseudoalteromonas rubra]TMP33982.1 hypothetical protein CWC00_08760 [Pseudoalteromonas rubra]